VNRFFRSALFPLIVIVALVYVASQVMLRSNKDEEKLTYSQLQTQIENGNVQEALFTPNRQ
jgi:cell division protease FtsH